MNKYRNKTSNGYASKKEERRAADLAMLQKSGEISELKQQVKYEIIPKQDGERAAHYIADFVYKDREGRTHVEDTKGFRTKEYILKRKLMLHVHGIRIEEL